MPVLSVLIPLYKNEKYLGKCLNSIYANNMDEVEVLLINDGSPDFSEEFSAGILQKYPGLVLLDKKQNEGIGCAYRDGFQKATGQYFMFVDSDDTIAPEAFAKLKAAVSEGNYDVVQFGSASFDPQGNKLGEEKENPAVFHGKSAIWKYHFTEYKSPVLSKRIFRREFFKDAVLLKQNVGIDEVLTPQLIFQADTLCVLGDILYYRLMHADSVSQQTDTLAFFQNGMNVYDALFSFFAEKDSEFLRYLQEKYLGFTMTFYNRALQKKDTSATMEQILKAARIDEYRRKFNDFKGCFEQDHKKRTAKNLFFKNRKLYDQAVRLLKR